MILVTGGTGLVGSYLLFALTAKGEKVRALIRSAQHIQNIREIFTFLKAREDQFSLIDWIEGDVTDFYSIDQAMNGIEQVYHCAAKISFDPRDRKSMIYTNVEGTSNIVNASLQHKVKKLCHVSSIASLGIAEQGDFIDENSKWKTSKRNSGYAISKYGSEREVWRGIEEGLNAVIVNPSVILGASSHPKATNRLFHSIEKMIPFYNDGVNGYVDVRDVVSAMIMLMESPVSGERFVLNSENLSLRELFTMAAGLLGKKPPFIPIGKVLMSLAWRLEWLRGRITGKTALITRENMRSAQSKTFYSSKKFAERFQFSFIPIKNSLEDAFKILGRIDHPETRLK
jgi:nucleoside-diphosphate-sugar epimerase